MGKTLGNAHADDLAVLVPKEPAPGGVFATARHQAPVQGAFAHVGAGYALSAFFAVISIFAC